MSETQNSTAVETAPVQQSQDIPDAPTGPNPMPTPPVQKPDAGAPDTSLQPQGTDESNGMAPSTAGTAAAFQPQPDDSGPMAPQPQPEPKPQVTQATPEIAQTATPAPKTFLQKVLASSAEVFKAMGGGGVNGPYSTTIDANGVATRTPLQMSKTHIGLAIALEALSGGMAGAGAHGTAATGEAAAAGLQQGEKIATERSEAQKNADQAVQQDYVRKYETLKTNMAMYQTMQEVGKHNYDVANAPVEAMKPMLEDIRTKHSDRIGDPDVSESEAISIEQHSMHEMFRVPTQTIPKLDNDGKPIYTDSSGKPVPQGTPGSTPAWDHRFAMVHRDADVGLRDEQGNVLPAVQAQIAQGRLDPDIANSAQGARVPASTLFYNQAKTDASHALKERFYGDHGILQMANMYRDRRDALGGQASPNAYDPDKDSVSDIFGGNITALSNFVQAHASPQAIKDNNPAMIPAGPDWTGPVDKSGPIPIRVYADKDTGSTAADVYLTSRLQSVDASGNVVPSKETVTSFFNSIAGGTGPQTGAQRAATSVQPFVQAQAKATGIDPNIINSVIAEESSFRPGANGSETESSSTAKGLMMVNNPTAKNYGFDPDKMHDSEYGIKAGTTVLAGKIKDAGGDVRKGLMNYLGSADPKKNAAYADRIMQRADKFKNDPTELQKFDGSNQQDTQQAAQQSSQKVSDLVAAAFKLNGATNINDAPDHAKPVADWDAEIAKDPKFADRAIQGFQIAMKNSGDDPSLALKAMSSPRQAMWIEKMMGGSDVAADYKSMRAVVQSGVTESVKNSTKLQYEEQKRANEQKDIIKRNQPLIDNIVNGGTLDPTSIATMRASDRETIFGEILRRTGGRFSLQALRNMNNLSAEIADKFTAGTFGYKVGNTNTAYGHAGAAFDDLQTLKTLLPSGDISPYINKPVNEVLKSLRSANPQAADALIRYQLNAHNATVDWQNLLNNGHAIHENEEDFARSIINDATPFGTAETALKTLMSSAGQRIIPLDTQYGDTFTQGGKDRVHYPNMIEPQTVDVIRKIGDPLTMQQVARMESGGSNYGGTSGVSSPGTQVGLLLTKKAPQPGTPLPTGQEGQKIFQRYLDVYGKTDPGGEPSLNTIKQAMAKNGWAVK